MISIIRAWNLSEELSNYLKYEHFIRPKRDTRKKEIKKLMEAMSYQNVEEILIT